MYNTIVILCVINSALFVFVCFVTVFYLLLLLLLLLRPTISVDNKLKLAIFTSRSLGMYCNLTVQSIVRSVCAMCMSEFSYIYNIKTGIVCLSYCTFGRSIELSKLTSSRF